LLFAGTENSVYVSFNEGDSWQSLQLNLPHTSMRDLAIHGDDLVVGTHGRSFWILDDITPLRQLNDQLAKQPVVLFAPEVALRWRWNRNTDTPLPPEVPAGNNPPDGAILDYYLATSAQGPVTLEILDTKGQLVRRYSSTDKPLPMEKLAAEHPIPMYWARPEELLSGDAGMHRFAWDLHYPSPKALEQEFPISAIVHNTPLLPLGARALPGSYTVRLTVDGQSYTQPLTVRMDPRVKTPLAGLLEQFRLANRLTDMMHRDYQARQEIRELRTKVESQDPDLARQAAALAGAGGGRGAPAEDGESLSRLNGELASVLEIVEGADATPTTQAAAAVADLQRKLDALLARVRDLKAKVK